jgi:hypothetical protein
MSNSWAQPDPYQAAVAASPTSSLVGSVESWLWLCQLRGTKCIYIYIYIYDVNYTLYIIYNITVYIILYYSSLNGLLRRDYQKSTSADSVGGPNFIDHICSKRLQHYNWITEATHSWQKTLHLWQVLRLTCCLTQLFAVVLLHWFPHFNPEVLTDDLHIFSLTQRRWRVLGRLGARPWGFSGDPDGDGRPLKNGTVGFIHHELAA